MDETPEQESERIRREVEMAQARGDISAILRLITSSSQITTTDFIKKTCGGYLFLYYTYVENLHVRPTDMNDLVDGLLYLDAITYIKKKEINKNMRDSQ